MSIGSLSLKRARTTGDRPAGVRPAVAVGASVVAGGNVAQNGFSASAPTSAIPASSTIPASSAILHKGSDSVDRAQQINMVRPPKEVTDDELLARFQQGDEEGYVELYLRRQAEVYSFALRLAGGDRDLASDLFQETFIKVYRKAHTFRAVVSKDGQSGTNVLGWLYTIVRTTYLNHKRRRALVGLDDIATELPSTDRSLDPEYREEQSTLRERVEAAIASLSIEIREPFVLREFDGLSYQEISDQLRITLGAVRQRIYRAKLAMREQLWDLVQEASPTMLGSPTMGKEILNDEDARIIHH
jgi:RNA polymerase sigma-70 factor (ECF subfamily)